MNKIVNPLLMLELMSFPRGFTDVINTIHSTKVELGNNPDKTIGHCTMMKGINRLFNKKSVRVYKYERINRLFRKFYKAGRGRRTVHSVCSVTVAYFVDSIPYMHVIFFDDVIFAKQLSILLNNTEHYFSYF